jgi:hypothetical protein
VDIAVGVAILLLAVLLVEKVVVEVDVLKLLVLVLSAHVVGVAAAFEVTVNENPLSPP